MQCRASLEFAEGAEKGIVLVCISEEEIQTKRLGLRHYLVDFVTPI